MQNIKTKSRRNSRYIFLTQYYVLRKKGALNEKNKKCGRTQNKKEGKELELQDNIFYTPSEFAKLRNCSVPTALSIYNLQDFPSENFGKEKVALGSAIREWYKKKREKGNYQ